MSIQCAPGPSFFPMSVGFVFSNISSNILYSIVKIKMPYNDITTLLGSSRYSYSIDANDMRKANDI